MSNNTSEESLDLLVYEHIRNVLTQGSLERVRMTTVSPRKKPKPRAEVSLKGFGHLIEHYPRRKLMIELRHRDTTKEDSNDAGNERFIQWINLYVPSVKDSAIEEGIAALFVWHYLNAFPGANQAYILTADGNETRYRIELQGFEDNCPASESFYVQTGQEDVAIARAVAQFLNQNKQIKLSPLQRYVRS